MSPPRAASGSSRLSSILSSLFLALLACALLIQRLAGIQADSIDEAERAAAAGKTEEAIAAYRRALRSDFPLSSRTETAARALLALGDDARDRGEEDLSRLAYRSLVGGFNASQIERPIGAAAYDEASARLRLYAGGGGSDRTLGARPFAIFVAALGLGLALFFGFRMLLPRAEAGAPIRRVLLNAALFGSGLALFVAGLLAA